jgi:hypothetical protein
MNQLTTSFQKTDLGEKFLQDIITSNSYYLVTCMNENDAINNTFKDIVYNLYDNMIQGKKITSNNTTLVIRNIPYESNKIYDFYDDSKDLSGKDFYTVVSEGSTYHVFKCLNNNLNSPSTVSPSFNDIALSNNYSYYTSDGYQWKYIYSIDETVVDKLASVDYFPLIANTDVQNSAINGTIDSVIIENEGKGYDNYLEGAFKNSDIKINGNTSIYAVTNSIASSVNGFYTGCLLYISSGTGAGESRIVADYISNSNGNFIILDNGITENLTGSNYELYPSIKFFNYGSQTVNAVARALINSYSGNSVYRIEVLEPGKDYTYHTAEVIANSSVGVTQPASVRSIYAPKMGHGSDPATELLCRAVGISVTLSNSEANTIITNNDFNEIGILKDPKFSNVVFTFTSSLPSSFLSNEKILNIDLLNIGNCSVTINTSTITLNQTQTSLEDKKLLIKSGDLYQIVDCLSMSNSSQISISPNNIFTDLSAQLMILIEKSNCHYNDQINGTSIQVNSLSGNWQANDVVIGSNSFTMSTIDTISRNDKIKSFNTFIQSHKYDVTAITGTFEKNEIISQNNITSTLRSIVISGSNASLYTTNQKGIYDDNFVLIGETSNAQGSIISSTLPELEYGSGELLYLEQISNITRKVDQDETFVFYLEF